MQKYILYKKDTGEIKMYCDGKPKYDKSKLECIKLNVSKTDIDKIKSNTYYLTMLSKKLKFKEK